MEIITTAFKRRRLPHWEVAGKVYFLTFRLRNSLPKDVVLRLQEQRKSILSLEDNTDELNRFHRYEFREIEKILDSVHNDENSFLANDNIAPVLMEAFDYLENKYCWRFPSFVIMPNHIHCLCVDDKSGEAKKLTDVVGLFKRYTARRINDVMNRQGRVWVDENFDHWCRKSDKVESVKKYIANNPVKAKLVNKSEDWKWQK